MLSCVRTWQWEAHPGTFCIDLCFLWPSSGHLLDHYLCHFWAQPWTLMCPDCAQPWPSLTQLWNLYHRLPCTHFSSAGPNSGSLRPDPTHQPRHLRWAQLVAHRGCRCICMCAYAGAAAGAVVVHQGLRSLLLLTGRSSLVLDFRRRVKRGGYERS